jgi:hypothetical protein
MRRHGMTASPECPTYCEVGRTVQEERLLKILVTVPAARCLAVLGPTEQLCSFSVLTVHEAASKYCCRAAIRYAFIRAC